MSPDDSTLTFGPNDTRTGARGLPLIPALTILWHPDVERVGHIAPLTALLRTDQANLSRDEPIFLPPGSSVGRSVDHKAMSQRIPSLTIVAGRDGFELHPTGVKAPVEVDGRPFVTMRKVSPEDLARGLVITVGRHCVFCLHSVRVPIARSPQLGLVGPSDAIEDVRRQITQLADKRDPVLIRGPSGTGKDLSARALHHAGPRAGGPFVAVNMGTLTADRATADLFGYKKGAFTGATADHLGYFRAAAGGTLFLDEFGNMLSAVQRTLLRVLEDQEVQSLGSIESRKVDVRIVIATDAKLKEAVEEGRFNEALYNRLNAYYKIEIPPLRERREDVGALLVHVLRKDIGGTAQLQRLLRTDDVRPWLEAQDVAAVVLSPLMANVRSLIEIARALLKSAADPRANTHEIVEACLAGGLSEESPRQVERSQSRGGAVEAQDHRGNPRRRVRRRGLERTEGRRVAWHAAKHLLALGRKVSPAASSSCHHSREPPLAAAGLCRKRRRAREGAPRTRGPP